MLDSPKKSGRSYRVMNKNWTRILSSLLVLVAALMVSQLAFAKPHLGVRPDFDAPEIDPRLAIEGLALVGGATVLLWERIRRRR
jgi:hypothetical protein